MAENSCICLGLNFTLLITIVLSTAHVVVYNPCCMRLSTCGNHSSQEPSRLSSQN